MTLKDPVLQQGFEIICKNLAKLKEENKFLKEQCLILADGNVCSSTCSEIKKQLTKAKEIIKKLYDKAFRGIGFMELNDFNVLKSEVEQFIKEGQ